MLELYFKLLLPLPHMSSLFNGLVHMQFVVVLLWGHLYPRIRLASRSLFHEKISDWKKNYCLKEFQSHDIFIMDSQKNPYSC